MMRPARAVFVAIYQATFPKTPDWTEGPLPFEHGDIRADTDGRSSYYPPRTGRVLYGSNGLPRRWHKPMELRTGNVDIVGLEAVRLRDEPDAHGLIIIHMSTNAGDPLAVTRALARRSNARIERLRPAPPGQRTGDPQRHRPVHAQLCHPAR